MKSHLVDTINTTMHARLSLNFLFFMTITLVIITGAASVPASRAFTCSRGTRVWMVPTIAAIIASPSAGNVTGDAIPDIVYPTSDGRVTCIQGTNGSVMWNVSIAPGLLGEAVIVEPANGGFSEICIATTTGRVYILAGVNGTIVRSARVASSIDSSPAIADVNLDGLLELVIADNSTGNISSWSFASLESQWNISLSAPAFKGVIVGSISRHASHDVACLLTNGSVHCLDGIDGHIVWRHQLSNPSSTWSGLVAYDVDRDAMQDILLSAGTTIVCLDGETGALKSSFTLAGTVPIAAPPLIGNIDNDAEMEVVFQTSEIDQAINADDNSIVLRLPQLTPKCLLANDGPMLGIAALADTIGDGDVEMVAPHESFSLPTPKIKPFSSDNSDDFPDGTRFESIRPLVPADADGDGRIDIIVADTFDVYCYTGNGTKFSTRPGIPCNKGNPWHTSNFADVDNDTIPDDLARVLGLDHDRDGDGLPDGEEWFVSNTLLNNPDSDYDGLTDYDEVHIYHTSALTLDTDEDKINDYAEIFTFHTNPNANDSDADGVRDDRELFTYHSNPLDNDTDHDGLGDGLEVYTVHSNPALLDTDNDTLNDHDEYMIYHTNASDADTDHDGFSDAVEINVGTDPRNGANYPGSKEAWTALIFVSIGIVCAIITACAIIIIRTLRNRHIMRPRKHEIITIPQPASKAPAVKEDAIIPKVIPDIQAPNPAIINVEDASPGPPVIESPTIKPSIIETPVGPLLQVLPLASPVAVHRVEQGPGIAEAPDKAYLRVLRTWTPSPEPVDRAEAERIFHARPAISPQEQQERIDASILAGYRQIVVRRVTLNRERVSLNHEQLQGYLQICEAKGIYVITVNSFLDWLRARVVNQGPISELLEELVTVGVMRRDNARFAFLSSNYTIPAWTRFTAPPEPEPEAIIAPENASVEQEVPVVEGLRQGRPHRAGRRRAAIAPPVGARVPPAPHPRHRAAQGNQRHQAVQENWRGRVLAYLHQLTDARQNGIENDVECTFEMIAANVDARPDR
nr:PQQ-binding-like beta-propeller repeat protein [Candidatus Sigynarchaeota archaeon]